MGLGELGALGHPSISRGGAGSMRKPLPTLRPASERHGLCRPSHLTLGALFPRLCKTTGISGIPCLELW